MIEIQLNGLGYLQKHVDEIFTRGGILLSKYEGVINIYNESKIPEDKKKSVNKNDPAVYYKEVIYIIKNNFENLDYSAQLAVLSHEIGHYVFSKDWQRLS